MKDFRVVVDSSCLIGLSLVDQFELLKELFSDIYIPYAVYNEVVIVGRGEIGSEETEHAIESGWILKKTVRDKIAVNALSTILGEGESEVIILCEELGLDCALIDERKARGMAELMGISTMGVLGVIDLAIENGFLIVKKRVVDQLINLGFRISDRLYKKMFPDLK
jgi:predicted nucleic acid-binding protein